MALSKIKANSLGTTGTPTSSTFLSGTMAWTSLTADITGVTAGTGMTGGGTSGDVTLNVIGGTGIDANADDIAIDSTVATLTGTQTLTNKTITAVQLDIEAQGDLRLQDTTGGQYVALQAPGTVATSYTLTFPGDDGTNEQFLQTNGSGVLAWAGAGGATGAGGDTVFYENGPTVTTAYTVTANDNAVSAGPITINADVTLTGTSEWVIV